MEESLGKLAKTIPFGPGLTKLLLMINYDINHSSSTRLLRFILEHYVFLGTSPRKHITDDMGPPERG